MSTDKEYTVKDYCRMISRGILSGNNACGTLADAVSTGNNKYFEKAAEGVVSTIVSERDQLRGQLVAASQKESYCRYVLEFIAQNLGNTVQISDPAIIREMEKCLGRGL